MTRQLMLRPAAKIDLSDIWDYTAERWTPSQARTYVSGLIALLNLLCDQPETAPIFWKLSPPVSIYRYRSHLVIFTADAISVDVIRIVHSRSNWQALLTD